MAAKKKRPRSRKGTATRTDSATAKSKGAGRSTAEGASAAQPKAEGGPAPAGALHINRGEGPYYDAMSGRPDEPPPSLIPPEVQAELDRLKMVNRALRGALRSFLEDE